MPTPSTPDQPRRPATLEDLAQIQRQQAELIETLAEAVNNGQLSVKIQNVNMPFWALVGFLLKVMIAAIPATIAYALFLFISFVVITGIVAGSRVPR